MAAVRWGTARRGWWTLIVAALAAALALTFAGAPGVRVAQADEPDTDTSAAELTSTEQRVENVIAAARQYLGVAYRVGSEGPLLFDCSGLVFRAFSDASLVDRISGSRLRAAGYMRWFARQGLMTADEAQAQRGDLVVYNGGKHIGIYLGEGRTVSALLTGVTVHGLHGISQEVTGFLRPDWSGEGEVAPFVPVELPEVLEEPAVLVPAPEWIALDESAIEPVAREGVERVELRTATTRTLGNADGTFTTEFHAQPIHYLSPRSGELEPVDLRFVSDERSNGLWVTRSPVVVRAFAADRRDGFLSVSSGEWSLALKVLGRTPGEAEPTSVDDGSAIDYFDLLGKGVGLRLAATPDGFRSWLVLTDDPDRNRFSFVLDAPNLSATLDEAGDVLLSDEAGAVIGRIPRPMLVDSTDSDGFGGGLDSAATALEVDAADGRTVITVVVRQRFLAEAVYPAYLDLSLTGFGGMAPAADLAFVSSRHPDATLGGFARPEAAGAAELLLGRQPRSKVETEAFLRFNELASTLGVVDVATASLELLPYLQRDESVAALVAPVDGVWSADTLTWNTTPAVGEKAAEMTGPSGQWLAIDVSDYATDILSRGLPDAGLFIGDEEGATGTWKRVLVGDFGPRLVVTWSGLRPSPAVADRAVDESPFAWTLPAMAPAQERFQLQLSNDGFATLEYESDVVKGKAGRLPEWTLPADVLAESGDYEWRVRVRLAGIGWSEWSAPASFGAILTEAVLPEISPQAVAPLR